MRFREPTRQDWIRIVIRVVILTVGMVASVILLTYEWELVGFLLWIVLTVLSVAWFIRWHSRTFGYLCPNCGGTFTISARTNAMGLNLVDRKYLRCPHCGKHSACKAMVIDRKGTERAASDTMRRS